MQPKLPSPHPPRGGLAQHNHRWRSACALGTAQNAHLERERQDLLIVPHSLPVYRHASSDGWFIGRLEGVMQGSCLSIAIFEERHVYHMSFYQVVIH